MALGKGNKDKWVQALRSGKYEQTRGKLMSRDTEGIVRYCPLGVFLDVLEYPKDVDNLIFKHAHGYLHFGLSGSTELSPTEESAITRLNDIDKKPFKEIADYIEENL